LKVALPGTTTPPQHSANIEYHIQQSTTRDKHFRIEYHIQPLTSHYNIPARTQNSREPTTQPAA
jgi:hypothetical protein